jgi:hypothetical protein
LLISPVMRLLPSIAFLGFVAVATTGCVVVEDDGYDSSLLVSNHSDFEIHEMYVTDVDSATWGPNLLGGAILFPNESVSLAIECGLYDAMMIDETGAVCEVSNIDLCFDDADWVIRNTTCSLFEARAAANAAAGKTAPDATTSTGAL